MSSPPNAIDSVGGMFVFKAAVVGSGDAAREIAAAIEAAGVEVVLIDGVSFAGLGDVDLVIEAMPERMEVKHRVFAELDVATPGHAILATTTAGLSITEIGEITLRPEKVVGLHFAAPRVVEVVESDDTAPETAQAAANFVQKLVVPDDQDFATHYGTAILPARPRRPRDKAKVEVGVQVVERWILARLRNQRFFSLTELNGAIAMLLGELNGRPMRRLGVSRQQLFDELDRPALAALPIEPYVYAEWRQRRVGLDYHVDIDGHYYSVPHRLLRQQLEARITARTVELFHKGERVACHLLGGARGRHTTVTEHMPSSHRRHAGWTHERIQRDAAAIGPDTASLVEVILRSRPHPEQGFRACLGILRLARQYGTDRLEAACRRGLEIGARSYGSISSILDKGLDRQPLPRAVQAPELPLDHPNIRGSRYYH